MAGKCGKKESNGGSWLMDHGGGMTVMNLDKLEVWVRAKDFALTVYKEVIPHLPVEEKWNLTQQLKRAAQSIPAPSRIREVA